ncbi:MAG: SulP family inorganic anion transporter [Burkholderiales bacterium]
MPVSPHRIFPFLAWLPRLTRENLRIDALAGLTVALVAIPQSLAYAQLAGLPPYFGLYAALIPTIVGALFGSSSQLSTGPVALTSLLTAASIAPLAATGSEQYVAYAISVALLSGLFQLLFGIMRLGVLMNLLSHPVLMGFVNAAAILITLSQVPALFGVSSPAKGHALIDTWHVLVNAAESHGYSVLFGLVAIALLIAFRRFAPRLPGVLITVALLTAASYFVDYAGNGGRIVGDIPRGLPALALPSFSLDAWIELLPASFVIAVISFMEAMSSAKIAAIKTASKWDENQELVGQGLAKMAAAFCQTMPVSGSFSRSALNLASGARTGVSSIVAALCVLLTLLFFTPLLKYLPLPVLAAIIVMALTNLINLRSLRNAWRASSDDAIAAVLTFAATIAFAPQIQNGIFAGILVSLGLFIYRRMRPNMAIVEPASAQLGRDVPEDIAEALQGKLGIIRFDASLVFVNVSYFEDAVLQLERRHPGLRFVLVSASGINDLDASGVEMLASLHEGLRKNGIALVFSGVKPRVSSVLERTGLRERISAKNFFGTDQDAFAALARREVVRPPETERPPRDR